MGECMEQLEKVLSLHEAVIRRAESFKKAEMVYEEKKRAYEGALDDYNSARRSAAIKEITSRGETWCTYCRTTIKEREATFFLTVGKKRVEGGINGGEYGYESFSQLHRLCEECRNTIRTKDGRYGKWDETAKTQEEFHVHSVVTHMMIDNEDSFTAMHYYAEVLQGPVVVSKHGWKNEKEFHTPTGSMIEEVAKELGLPPERTYGDFV